MINNAFTVQDKEDKKMLKKVFWRTMTLSSTYNYERMQGLGYVYTMIPVIKRYYKNEEDRIEAYKRHYELFNTTPTMGGFITGLSTSMEKEASEDPTFDKNSINAVKLSLMGPFAGITEDHYAWYRYLTGGRRQFPRSDPSSADLQYHCTPAPLLWCVCRI